MHHTTLESIPLFARLSEEDRIAVARNAREMHCAAGTELVTDGEFSYELFAIETGAAEVVHEGALLAELGPGEIFGEMGVLPHGGLKWGRRIASVVVTEQMTVIVISGHDLRELLEEIPTLGEAVLATVAERDAMNSLRHS
jgi:CRP/FNR family transcriptional regulator, cyclic AMP receptor protein